MRRKQPPVQIRRATPEIRPFQPDIRASDASSKPALPPAPVATKNAELRSRLAIAHRRTLEIEGLLRRFAAAASSSGDEALAALVHEAYETLGRKS